MPPKDVYDGERLWFLLKATNGTREASRQWVLYIKVSIGPHGFLASAAIPGLFYHPEWDIMMACHGDDFLAEGLAEDLDKLDEVMKANFEKSRSYLGLEIRAMQGKLWKASTSTGSSNGTAKASAGRQIRSMPSSWQKTPTWICQKELRLLHQRTQAKVKGI